MTLPEFISTLDITESKFIDFFEEIIKMSQNCLGKKIVKDIRKEDVFGRFMCPDFRLSF